MTHGKFASEEDSGGYTWDYTPRMGLYRIIFSEGKSYGNAKVNAQILRTTYLPTVSKHSISGWKPRKQTETNNVWNIPRGIYDFSMTKKSHAHFVWSIIFPYGTGRERHIPPFKISYDKCKIQCAILASEMHFPAKYKMLWRRNTQFNMQLIRKTFLRANDMFLHKMQLSLGHNIIRFSYEAWNSRCCRDPNMPRRSTPSPMALLKTTAFIAGAIQSYSYNLLQLATLLKGQCRKHVGKLYYMEQLPFSSF